MYPSSNAKGFFCYILEDRQTNEEAELTCAPVEVRPMGEGDRTAGYEGKLTPFSPINAAKSAIVTLGFSVT